MEVVVSKCKEVSRSDQLGGIASRDERRVSIVDGPSAPPRCAWCADRSRLVRVRVRVGVRVRVRVRVRVSTPRLDLSERSVAASSAMCAASVALSSASSCS